MPVFESTHIPKPKALDVFTGRADEQGMIRAFLTRLAKKNQPVDKPILSFHGVGGVGKTLLITKCYQEIVAQQQRDIVDTFPPVSLVLVDVDTPGVDKTYDSSELFWQIRNSLARAYIDTPLFDFMYIANKKLLNPFEKMEINTGLSGELIELVKLVDITGIVSKIQPMWNWFLDQYKAFRFRQTFETPLEELTIKARQELMPQALACDLMNCVSRHPGRHICLAIDGFERIQSTLSLPDAQNALQKMIAIILGGKHQYGGYWRIGFMILGREKLRWRELYDERDQENHWERYIDAHVLEGLPRDDALEFLVKKAGQWYADNEYLEISQRIKTHCDAILQAASETASGEVTRYLPYYLDLALDMICRAPARITAEMFGKTPRELEDRFLRYFPRDQRTTFETLALTLVFDKAVFEFLVHQGCIQTHASQEFYRLVGEDNSFIHAIPDEDDLHRYYKFHRHMQDSLIRSISNSEESQRVAGDTINLLLNYFLQKASFERLTDLTSEKKQAYQLGMDILRSHAESNLIDAKTMCLWFEKFNVGYDAFTEVSRRLRDYQWAYPFLVNALGTSDIATLGVMDRLSLILMCSGEFITSQVLQERSLRLREQIPGEKGPAYIRLLGNLGINLVLQHKHSEAELILQQVLSLCEKTGDPDQVTVGNSLGALGRNLDNQGRHTEAETMFRRAMIYRENATGLARLFMAHSLRDLGEHLDNQGRHSEAEALFRRALTIPPVGIADQTDSLMGLGCNLELQEQYAEAEVFFRRSLAIQKEWPDIEYRHRERSLSALAINLVLQEKYIEAEPFHRQALACHEEYFGTDQLGLALRLESLGLDLDAQCKFTEAESFRRRALTIYERHSDCTGIVRSLYHLGRNLDCQRRYTEAEALFRQALVNYTNVVDPEAVSVEDIIYSLVSNLISQGCSAEAERIFLGLMNKLRDQGRDDAAEEFLEGFSEWVEELYDKLPPDLE